MIIKENKSNEILNEGKELRYFYRLTEVDFNGGQAYGIEIERQDVVDGLIVKLERDSIEKISNKEDKVRSLLELAYKNLLSPFHLVDVLGEYCDEYVLDFEEQQLLLTV